jgi:hypothetical protein
MRAAVFGVVFQGVSALYQLLATALIVRAHGTAGLGGWMTVYAFVGVVYLGSWDSRACSWRGRGR